jgi:ribosome biogenesis protein Tsr3
MIGSVGQERANGVGTAKRLPVFVRFVAPYARTSPDLCTGSLLIERGLAQESAALPRGGVLLTPCAAEVLSPADAAAARQGVCLIDGPWECLAGEADREAQRGMTLRKIPDRFAPRNPFYRREAPIYAYRPERLATAEAAGVALLVLGFRDQASLILRELAYCAVYLH